MKAAELFVKCLENAELQQNFPALRLLQWRPTSHQTGNSWCPLHAVDLGLIDRVIPFRHQVLTSACESGPT